METALSICHRCLHDIDICKISIGLRENSIFPTMQDYNRITTSESAPFVVTVFGVVYLIS